VTKPSDKDDPLAALRIANRQPRPKREVPAPALPFSERHPEWKARRPNRPRLRRIAIREG
jgi:hypothetical protein